MTVFDRVSELFFNATEGQEPRDVVVSAYEDLLGIEDAEAMPNAEDRINFWVGELDSGAVARADFAGVFLESASIPEQGGLVDPQSVADNLAVVAAHAQLFADNPDAELSEYAQLAADTRAEDRDPVDPGNGDDPGEPGDEFTLTASADTLEGTADNDTFEAPLTTIEFTNGNTLNSGDSLDGAGGNNTLNAELINDSFVNSGLGAVRPSTENVQDVIINAIQTSGSGTVTLDAADMVDLENVWSQNSNADLIIQDVNTLTSSGAARNTEDLTFRMDHTSNDNSSGSASDLTVYFDENYLLSGQVSDDSTIQYRVMNQDAFDAGQVNDFDLPLISVTFADLRFTLEGEEYDLADFMEEDDVAGEQIQTYQDMADAMNDALDQLRAEFPDRAELADVEAFLDGSTFEDPDGREGEVVSLSAPGEFELGFPTANPNNSVFLREAGENAEVDGVTVESSNRFDRAQLGVDAEETDLPVTTNLELHKVGRGGDGGDAEIGGKAGGEIPVINVDVLGDSDKPSNVGYIGTTNDAMRTVDIDTDDTTLDSFASLTIRNGFGDGSQQSALIDEVNADDFLGDLSVGTDTPITNVAVFSATGGGDVEYNADYSTGLNHTVTTGGGDDEINVGTNTTTNPSGDTNTSVDITSSGGDNDVFLFGGTINGTVDTGNGDDFILVQSAGGATPQLTTIEFDFNDGEDDFDGGNITFDVNGESFDFDLTAGENFGDLDETSQTQGDFTATWNDSGVVTIEGPGGQEFDVTNIDAADGNVDQDVTPDVPQTAGGTGFEFVYDDHTGGDFQFFDAKVQVTFDGVESEWVDIDSTDFRTSTGQINDAVLAAVAGKKALDDILDVSVNESGSLSIDAITSGVDDLEIDIRGPVGEDDDITGSEDWKPFLNQIDESTLDDAFEEYFPGSEGVGEGSGDFTGYNDFLEFIQDNASALGIEETDGRDLQSPEVSEVVVEAGGGEDTIALSSNLDSNDTVVFEGNFGENTIYNFGLEADDGNDVLDFTSYLDEDAAVRSASGEGDDFRNEEQVDFSFTGFDNFDGDHNEVSLVSFEALWDELDEDDQVSFADFGTSELESSLNELFNNFEEGGADSAVGNEFVILVGKDGDALVDENGDFDTVETDFATNEFKVFQGEVVEDDNDNLAYEISNEAGLVNLANSDLDDLAAADFGF